VRALIFTGGGQPFFEKARPVIGFWDFVVAADSGLEYALDAGITPDLVVGDMDSLRNPDLLLALPRDRICLYPRDKDYSDTDLAFLACRERGVDDIVLIGGGGGRIDHFMALQSLFVHDYCPSLWITDENITAFINDGASLRVEGLAPEDAVSLFPVGKSPHRVRGDGLFWGIDGLSWDQGLYSLSNRSVSGEIRVASEAGRFLCVLPLRTELTLG